MVTTTVRGEQQRERVTGIISFAQQQSNDRPQSDAANVRAPESLSKRAEIRNPWEIVMRLKLLQGISKT